MSDKIRGEHLQRGAYVYVRQSTPYQVRNHLEGKERQYSLAERAKQLGFSKVVVIDEDLGRSGSGAQERLGFGRLLASVCQGLAGAVFALEASRLARNNRDWHHLVDLCALAETLLIDTDGICAQVGWDRLTPILTRWIPQPRTLHPYPDARFNAITLNRSRMRKRAGTDLCGGRSAMVVPTATVELAREHRRLGHHRASARCSRVGMVETLIAGVGGAAHLGPHLHAQVIWRAV